MAISPMMQQYLQMKERYKDASDAVGFNIWLAHRMRPPLSAMSMEQQNLDRYRMGIAPYKKWLLLGITALVGLIAGASASGQWRTWLMWVNGVSFGQKDPQFKLDVSFYAFDLPWYRFLLGFGFAATILALIAAALTHYLYGGLRVTSPGARATAAATGAVGVVRGHLVAAAGASRRSGGDAARPRSAAQATTLTLPPVAAMRCRASAARTSSSPCTSRTSSGRWRMRVTKRVRSSRSAWAE